MKNVYAIEFAYYIELNVFDGDWDKFLNKKIFKTQELAEKYLAENGYAQTDENEYTKSYREKAKIIKFEFINK